MRFEPSATQEPASIPVCPQNPFGHSWKGISRLEGRTQQRCRFCQQTREVRLTALQRSRTQQPSALVTQAAPKEHLAPR